MGSSTSTPTQQTSAQEATPAANPNLVTVEYDKTKIDDAAKKKIDEVGLMFKTDCKNTCTAQDHEDYIKSYGYVSKDDYDKLKKQYDDLAAKHPDDAKATESFAAGDAKTKSLLGLLIFFALVFVVFYIVYLKDSSTSIGLRLPFTINSSG